MFVPIGPIHHQLNPDLGFPQSSKKNNFTSAKFGSKKDDFYLDIIPTHVVLYLKEQLPPVAVFGDAAPKAGVRQRLVVVLFRSRSSCADHNNTLRIIFGHCAEFISTLHLLSTNLEKIFDSVNREYICPRHAEDFQGFNASWHLRLC